MIYEKLMNKESLFEVGYCYKTDQIKKIMEKAGSYKLKMHGPFLIGEEFMVFKVNFHENFTKVISFVLNGYADQAVYKCIHYGEL